jgi:hypothetical protein
MSLPLLVIIVVTGISLVVAAVHYSGGSAVLRIDSERQVIDRFNADFPEDKIEQVWRAEDAMTAVLAFERGAGIVRAIGDKLITRRIPDHAVSVSRQGKDVTLGLNERIWRGCKITLPTEPDAIKCEAALNQSQLREKAA